MRSSLSRQSSRSAVSRGERADTRKDKIKEIKEVQDSIRGAEEGPRPFSPRSGKGDGLFGDETNQAKHSESPIPLKGKSSSNKSGAKKRQEKRMKKRAKSLLRRLYTLMIAVPFVGLFCGCVAVANGVILSQDSRSYSEYFDESFGSGDNYSARADATEYAYLIVNAWFLWYGWEKCPWATDHPVGKYFLPCFYLKSCKMCCKKDEADKEEDVERALSTQPLSTRTP
eukprot:CAMPEP_0170168946 /NCGR_PEP_ID=MMETSP0040_2-20121228/1898_1 /TAXON_ID=641309 /ORGANISM="Lotharella oceanica, Strain CCMP622" /LENGTH=226 /DNA_ID=CAMNT_0010407411 /DNA_START=658 /DNA_END=1338 /DNA_ORIENTATION=+